MNTSIVLELQQRAPDPHERVADLLRKALTVARTLEVQGVESWLVAEVNGHSDGADLPTYRGVTGEIKAWNPYNRLWIPLVFGDPVQAKAHSKCYNGQSVAELEHVLETRNKQGC